MKVLNDLMKLIDDYIQYWPFAIGALVIIGVYLIITIIAKGG